MTSLVVFEVPVADGASPIPMCDRPDSLERSLWFSAVRNSASITVNSAALKAGA
jgi:hypothetical protein